MVLKAQKSIEAYIVERIICEALLETHELLSPAVDEIARSPVCTLHQKCKNDQYTNNR